MRSFHLITILFAGVCITSGHVLQGGQTGYAEAITEETMHPDKEQATSVNRPYLNGEFIVPENKNYHFKMVKVFEENPVFTLNNFGDEDDDFNIDIRNGEGLKITYPKGEIFVPTKKKKIHIKTIDIFDENTADAEYGGYLKDPVYALQNQQRQYGFQNQHGYYGPRRSFKDPRSERSDVIGIKNIFDALQCIFENIISFIISFFTKPCTSLLGLFRGVLKRLHFV